MFHCIFFFGNALFICRFFQAVTILLLHHTDSKCQLQKLNRNYTRMLSNKSRKQQAAEQPLTSHLTNHSNKTCWALLEKQSQTYQ